MLIHELTMTLLEANDSEMMSQNRVTLREVRACADMAREVQAGQRHLSNQVSQLTNHVAQLTNVLQAMQSWRQAGNQVSPHATAPLLPAPSAPQPIPPLPPPSPAAPPATTVTVTPMKFTAYLEWKNQKQKNPGVQFSDWFIHSLELGYKEDAAIEPLKQSLKQSFKRHKQTVKWLLRYCSECPPSRPSDARESAAWESRVHEIAAEAVMAAKLDLSCGEKPLSHTFLLQHRRQIEARPFPQGTPESLAISRQGNQGRQQN